jgi:hypothetical protein
MPARQLTRRAAVIAAGSIDAALGGGGGASALPRRQDLSQVVNEAYLPQ